MKIGGEILAGIDILTGGFGGLKAWEKREYEPVYDDYTASFLLERMLSRISDKFDKREGSVIYDALAPAAIELEIMYMELDWILKNVFGDTADRTGLIAVARDRGIRPYPATQASVKGKFNVAVDIGRVFNIDDLNFTVKAFIKKEGEDYYYELICDKFGEIGNVSFGKLIPVEPVKGLKNAEIVSVIKPGEEEEDTEEFRSRYYRTINSKSYGGNIDQYLEWVHAIDGVGGVKVYPVWDGGGTVKVVFSDAKYRTPSSEFVDQVQTIIDPVTNHGEGIGLAPIGHTVTVLGAKEESVDFAFDLLYMEGHSWETVKDGVKEALDLYLGQLRKDWEHSGQTVIRVTRIETRLLDVEGVLDINETKINGLTRNYTVDGESLPVVGDVSVY